VSHSAVGHDGTRTCRDASLTGATPAPTVPRPAPAETPGLAARGLAPSRMPAGISFPGTALVWRKPLARPSQIPVASAGKDGLGGSRYTSPVLDVVGKGGGRPLDPKVRADMEARLGSDFSDVRIHTGDQAARSAAGVSAMAYTVGNEVVFGRGSFDPASHEGRHRLAHELVHVQQQRQGPVSGTDSDGAVTISDPADSFEQEAEATAARVASGSSLGAPGDLRGHHLGRPSDQLTEGRSAQRCGGMPCDCAADEQDSVQGGSAGAPALQPVGRAALARSASPIQRDDDTQDSTTPDASPAPTDMLPGPGDATPSSDDGAIGTVEPLVGGDSGLVEEDGAPAGEAPTDDQSADVQTLALQRDDATGAAAAGTSVDAGAATGVASTMRLPLAATVDPHEWDDYQGNPDNSRPHAWTKLNIFLDANGFTINVFIDSAKSWVRRSDIGDGTTRNSADADLVAKCHDWFAKGHSWYRFDPSAKCPAAAAIAFTTRATTDGECETVLGPGLDSGRVAETNRLFRHELYHMRLAYAVAVSAAPSSDRKADLKRVKKANNVYQKMYDRQTKHGCNQGSQSSWEQKIDAGNLNLDKPA
jgi:hypothetical protein